MKHNALSVSLSANLRGTLGDGQYYCMTVLVASLSGKKSLDRRRKNSHQNFHPPQGSLLELLNPPLDLLQRGKALFT